MRPIIIGIGGGHSGAGKTGIACEILRKHPGWGAIKYTKTSLYGSITDDINVLSEKGKDTKRFLDSGAGKVVWVQSPYQDFPEIFPLALGMLSHLEGVVVEGNSAVEYLRPEIVIFVSGSGEKIKDGAEKILQIADVVIYDREPPVEMPQGVKKFQKDEVENILDFISQTINNLRHK